MEPLAVDDDICILKHETAYGTVGESPVSVCAGDESVASHFALVTAYEDIKKRLRETERENTLLRKRVKQLEDKLFRPEAPPSEGPQYMNKAFSAYRGIYMEKEDLQQELNKLKKKKSESERLLTEQLQAKEMELLQLRTEMDTSQVMRSLSTPQDYWHVDTIKADLKIPALSEDLAMRLSLENRPKEVGIDQQRAASSIPVQCLDDVEKNNNILTVARAQGLPPPPSPLPVPSSSGRPGPPVGPPAGPCLLDSLKEDCWNGPWTNQPPLAAGSSPILLPPPPLNQASLDDSSWSFPSPPKPSDDMFWEGHSSTVPVTGHCSPKSPPQAEWAKPF
ncbi:LOW QUALITY PROTEIN: 5-azacytidine-induced protein 2 [Aplochiton taeniatus]